MGQKKSSSFQFPVSTLVGSDYGNLRKIRKGHSIDRKYRQRYILTGLGSLVLSFLALIEKYTTRRRLRNVKVESPPVFIIGYWRSGTTFLHTMLCSDKNAAFVDTFQGIFPNHIFLHKMWISFLARYLMPSKRPVDGVRLDMKLPQEEEIALGNMQHISFYNFFYFPADIRKIIDLSLHFEGVGDKELSAWKDQYSRLIRSALMNTGGKQFISKSPPNTFRIPLLLEMFPNARFIFLYRDPVYVLSSFKKFATKVAQGIGFQEIDGETLERPLCDLYKDLVNAYKKDKHMIPPENLMEVLYDDLMNDAVGTVEKIYRQFGMGEPNYAGIEKMLKEKPPGSTSRYDIPDTIREFVDRELSDLTSAWEKEKS